MNDVPPPIPPAAQPKADNWFRQMARASWLAPLFAIGINFVLMASQPVTPGRPDYVRGIVGAVLIFGGFIVSVVALTGVRKYGRSGILVPALVGIGLNLSLIILGASPFFILAKTARNRVHLQPAVHSASAMLVTNETLRFSIDIPVGFRDFPEGKRTPNIEHAYVKGVGGGDEALTCINVEHLGGLLPKNKPLRKVDMPPGFNGELTNRNWRGVKLDTLVTTVEQNGLRVVVYTVQVPLRPSAIQLNVGGPESKRAELSELTDTLLASIDGDTNW